MIYCVEDDDNIRELVIYTLETTGLKARGFAEGSAFMEALAFDTPELILLDIMLPGDDGLELLKKLMRNQGIVLTRDQLLTEIWGYDFDGETRTVDVHIRTLRQKLGTKGEIIQTVRGVGYRVGGVA